MTDYADDLALLINSAALAKYLLRSLKQASGSNNRDINANKTELMCFTQKGTSL